MPCKKPAIWKQVFQYLQALRMTLERYCFMRLNRVFPKSTAATQNKAVAKGPVTQISSPARLIGVDVFKPQGPVPMVPNSNAARGKIVDAWMQKSASQLPANIKQGLLDGVSKSRGITPETQEGWLGFAHVRNAAKNFSNASATDKAALQKSIDAAKTFARPLILKVLSSRGAASAVTFSKAIANMDAQTLSARVSVLDVHQNDGKSTGLAQRWSGSCVPTSLQMARAEADPSYALELTKGVINNADARDFAAAEQKALLEKHNGKAVGRNEKNGSGINYSDIDDVADEVLSSLTGRDYELMALDNYLPPAQRMKRLEQVTALLEEGVDVPVTIPGHCMLLTDTRVGPDNVRRFLLQDPYSGTNQWHTSDALARDGFGLKDFYDKTNINGFYVSVEK
jgi:hypothetical protein